MAVEKFNYTYEMLRDDLAKFYKENQEFKNEIKEVDSILALSRGGLIVGQYLGYMYGIRDVVGMPVIGYDNEVDSNHRSLPHLMYFQSMMKNRNVLIVDDICDSGRTLEVVYNNFLWYCSKITIFTLFGKKDKISSYYLREHDGRWVNFPWDLDLEYIKGGLSG